MTGSDAQVTEEQELVVSGPPGDPVLVLRLNRPHRLNALSATMVGALLEALDRAPGEGRKAVILTGTGRGFCAGFDLKQADNGNELEQLESQQRLAATLVGLRVPVIAAINGLAVGAGCEIALACDFVLAATDAELSLPEVRVGTAMGGGSSHLLPRAVGRLRALELVLIGEPISAARAERIGLITSTVDPVRLMPAAHDLARTLSMRPAHAVAAVKAAMQRGMDQTFAQALEVEIEEIKNTNAHPDSGAIVDHFRRNSTYGDGGKQ